MTYPLRTRETDPRVLDSLRPALIGAGLLDEETGKFTGSQHDLVAALTCGLRQIESVAPWGDAFALMIRADWRSIDGTDPGDVQMRFTEIGVQLRERVPVAKACTVPEHFTDPCDNCWMVSVLEPSGNWRPIGTRLQIRLRHAEDPTAATRRVEIRRRTDPSATQTEAVWTDPWVLPKSYQTEFNKKHRDDRNVDTTWVDASPEGDVQISEGHTFPRGILVRQATGREDEPWTSPRFLPETHWHWSDLLLDGSMQFRCWRTREQESAFGNYRIELRQRVGRTPVLAVEPWWGKHNSNSYSNTVRANGYTMELLRDTRGYSNFRSVLGVRVTDPSGATRDHLVVSHSVLAAPDLLVEASSQGYFSWKFGSLEPPAQAITWSMPQERALWTHQWTMLNSTVRAKIALGPLRGDVRIEVLGDTPVRRHWWSRPSPWVLDSIVPFSTTHEPTDSLRVTFRPDHVAEIQLATPAKMD